MKNFQMLTDAVEFIESNLCEEISQDDIAKACFCSLSSLQKTFRYAFHCSLKEYISKRRLTNAARDLVSSDMTVTDIAMKYCYNSPEVFTRAFTRAWHTLPSRFASEWKFTGLFPRFNTDVYFEGGYFMGSRKYDVSQLYDLLRSKNDTAVLCFDIVGLMSINDEIGHEAGDAAILEGLSRIDSAAGEDMLTMRVGGDEFILVTGLDDMDEAKKVFDEIMSHNGETVSTCGIDMPVSLHGGITRFESKNLRYGDFFSHIEATAKA